VSRWIEDVRAERGTDVVIMLVGNKTDLTDRRCVDFRFPDILTLYLDSCRLLSCSQVSTEDGERKAREEGVLFMETSAKAGYNIKNLFRTLATALPGSTGTPGTATNPTASNLIDIKLQDAPPVDRPDAGGCSC
jgi:Ras-related protein Rab-6A